MFIKLKNKGYNLMELIVVIIIIGVLIAMAVPKYLDHKKQADLAVIQNDSIVVRNVAMADYMSTDKLPNGKQGSPEDLIENLDKQLEAGKIFKNGFLIQTEEELGPKKEDQGGEEFKIASNKIKDFYLLNDNWVRVKTKSALPGRFLLDSDFNVYYVAKGGFDLDDKPDETDDNNGESNEEDEEDEEGEKIKDIEDKIDEIEKDIEDANNNLECDQGYVIKKEISKLEKLIEEANLSEEREDEYKRKVAELIENASNLCRVTKFDRFAAGEEMMYLRGDDGISYAYAYHENGLYGVGLDTSIPTNGGSVSVSYSTHELELQDVKDIILVRDITYMIDNDDSLWVWGRRLPPISRLTEQSPHNSYLAPAPTKLVENVLSVKASFKSVNVVTKSGKVYWIGAPRVKYRDITDYYKEKNLNPKTIYAFDTSSDISGIRVVVNNDDKAYVEKWKMYDVEPSDMKAVSNLDGMKDMVYNFKGHGSSDSSGFYINRNNDLIFIGNGIDINDGTKVDDIGKVKSINQDKRNQENVYVLSEDNRVYHIKNNNNDLTIVEIDVSMLEGKVTHISSNKGIRNNDLSVLTDKNNVYSCNPNSSNPTFKKFTVFPLPINERYRTDVKTKTSPQIS